MSSQASEMPSVPLLPYVKADKSSKVKLSGAPKSAILAFSSAEFVRNSF